MRSDGVRLSDQGVRLSDQSVRLSDQCDPVPPELIFAGSTERNHGSGGVQHGAGTPDPPPAGGRLFPQGREDQEG